LAVSLGFLAIVDEEGWGTGRPDLCGNAEIEDSAPAIRTKKRKTKKVHAEARRKTQTRTKNHWTNRIFRKR
jgi:hypothetical protein